MNAETDDQGEIVLKVSDTGRGIPPEAMFKVTEPFGQVKDTSTADPLEGIGLGLPISRHLVELHGGTLTIDSEEGNGTTVTLAFPTQTPTE